MKYLFSIVFFLQTTILFAQQYTNPVLLADYSDPDVVRVGKDYYMTASSFNSVPGLPILHSVDLANWKLIGHALPQLTPTDYFSKVRHGGGVWAPSIRYHNNRFYIYYPDPDFGIYVIQAKSINGPWSSPKMVQAGKGLIDPCLLWDDDGKNYLVHAYAGSRAGIKSIIVIKELNATADSVIGNPVLIYDGHANDPTVEGPKIYKRNGYYYILAPAGGVSTGWQIALRSKNIYGPYERKIVMQQGSSTVNGPHHGAWVNTEDGKDWFLHFQDLDAYGRIVHLQPMQWKNNFPVIGVDADGDGIGEPIIQGKNSLLKNKQAKLKAGDEFNSQKIALEWQWQANPQTNWLFTTNAGFARLNAVSRDSFPNLWNQPNILCQKFPEEAFTATVNFFLKPITGNEQFSFMVLGTDYAAMHVKKSKIANELTVQYVINKNADKNNLEDIIEEKSLASNGTIYLRIQVVKNAICKFEYSSDGKEFLSFDKTFTAKPGKWVGAKIGMTCTTTNATNDNGFADVDWVHVEY